MTVAKKNAESEDKRKNREQKVLCFFLQSLDFKIFPAIPAYRLQWENKKCGILRGCPASVQAPTSALPQQLPLSYHTIPVHRVPASDDVLHYIPQDHCPHSEPVL